MISRIKKDPKYIFLLDGFGAFISMLFLGVVLVVLEPFFGIPKHVLFVLASLPFFFLLYDVYCFKKKIVAKRNIQIIAYTNLFYCLLSATLTIAHYKEITALGWFYICIEILIVLSVVILEFKISKNLIAS